MFFEDMTKASKMDVSALVSSFHEHYFIRNALKSRQKSIDHGECPSYISVSLCRQRGRNVSGS